MTNEKLNKISQVMGVSVNEILYGDRKGENVFARSICCYLLRKDLNLYDVAKVLNMTYSNVHFHEKKVKSFIEMKDKKVCEMLEKIYSNI